MDNSHENRDEFAEELAEEEEPMENYEQEEPLNLVMRDNVHVPHVQENAPANNNNGVGDHQQQIDQLDGDNFVVEHFEAEIFGLADEINAQLVPKKRQMETLFNCAWNSYLKMFEGMEFVPEELVKPITEMTPMVIIQLFEAIDVKNELLGKFMYKLITNMDILEILLKYPSLHRKLHKMMSFLVNQHKILISISIQQNYVKYLALKHNPNPRTDNIHYIQVDIYDAAQIVKIDLTKMLTLAAIPPSARSSRGEDDVMYSKEAYRIHNLRPGDAIPHVNLPGILFGLRIGSFLIDAGWFTEAVVLLTNTAKYLVPGVCVSPKTAMYNALRIDCLRRLLNAETLLSELRSALDTCLQIIHILHDVKNDMPKELMVCVYTSISNMYFARHEYDQSETWAKFAIRDLDDSFGVITIVEALCIASKVCTVKHEYVAAHHLASQAEHRALTAFGDNHYMYAETLNTYAFLLLKVHAYPNCLTLYYQRMRILYQYFGPYSFRLAMAHEDLAAAHYMSDYYYSTFNHAKYHISKALSGLESLLPSTHLKFASVNCIRAVINYEASLVETRYAYSNTKVMNECNQMLTNAMCYTVKELGEKNLQMGIILGNTGRLYQTMRRYTEAAELFDRAIKIKREKLGSLDYEVAVTMTHLANLYNDILEKPEEAEQLYLESIRVFKSLYGADFEGIKFNYQGLCKVYRTLGQQSNVHLCLHIIEQWDAQRIYPVYVVQFLEPSSKKDCQVEEIKKIYSAKGMVDVTDFFDQIQGHFN